MMRMNKMIFTVCGMLLLSSCGNINEKTNPPAMLGRIV